MIERIFVDSTPDEVMSVMDAEKGDSVFSRDQPPKGDQVLKHTHIDNTK